MAAFTNVDTASINKGGVLAFEASPLAADLVSSIAAKDADVANAALGSVKSLCEDVDQWVEPYLVECLPAILEALADKKTVEAANVAGTAILAKSSPNSIRVVTSLIYESFTSLKWQTKKGGLVLLGALGKVHPEIVQRNLPEMILKLIDMASDVKKDVKEQTRVTFNEICATITNVDIIPIIPKVIDGYCDPVKKAGTAMDALVATTFINDVDMPTLGLLVPILTKGMRERAVATKRRSALVIGNMCKLVNDPRTAALFYPILKPVLERGIDEIQVEEVRKVCQHSLDTLQRVSGEAAELSAAIMTQEQLEECIKDTLKANGCADPSKYAKLTIFSAKACNFLVQGDNRRKEEWEASILPYATAIVGAAAAAKVVEVVTEKGTAALSLDKVELEDLEEDLCNAQFSLAYGTRVLLHQTPFRVKIGRKYGLVGPNGAGKSTLMKSIAGGNLAGFPTDIITVYVECEIIGEKADQTVIEYIMTDPKIIQCGCEEKDVIDMLTEMGFGVNRTAAALDAGVSTLSGGWRMKLALSRAMLLSPQMLLLDEPTNHLDQFAVKWLTEYIQNLKTCTCLVVSHDTGFLDNVCTNIIHYENLKLKSYLGNLTEFVRQKPEAKAYYELSSDIVAFGFPEPGPLEGVKSLTKAVLKTKDVHFQYPTAPFPQLINVSIQCSLASRVAVVGVNGAGKSTLVKLMVGELEPDQGTIEKHPNLRVAYVAQHAFAHIEDHLDMTPCEYVMWRYRGGYDKEMAEKDSQTMTEEEMKELREKAKKMKNGVIDELINRRVNKKEFEYEAVWEGDSRENSWHSKTELLEWGYKKHIDKCDEAITMENMLGQRKLTTGEIQKHFDSFGLEPAFAQHTRMGALSGGQKVKVVLGAGLWNLPHLVILDEPTNFLDRDSLGALATAIKEFKGGIFMISHNAEFYEALCPEKWILESGRLTVMGAEWMEEVEKARKKAEKLAKRTINLETEDEKFDSLGNSIKKEKKEESGEPAELTKKERKELMKTRKQMIKNGEDTYDLDIKLGIE